jgi:hypothetical protein
MGRGRAEIALTLAYGIDPANARFASRSLIKP